MRLLFSRTEAETIVNSAEHVGRQISELSQVMRKIENTDSRRELLKEAGWLMMELYERIMRPVILQYPDLDPDNKQKQGGKRSDD
jgi:hypothetical protein